MLAYRYPLIAREGWLWIFILFCAAFVATYFAGEHASPLWVIVLSFIILFRDPHREIPASPLGVICPVDGKVVAIREVQDDYLDRSAICVSLQMNLASVFSIRSPMEGKIINQWHNEPRKIRPTNVSTGDLADPGASSFAQWVQSDEGDDVVLVVEAKWLVPRPHCYAHSGERIGQGQRCGFLRFGTRVDVLLPPSSRIEVAVNDRLRSGTDLIAMLVREAQVGEKEADKTEVESVVKA